MSLRLSFLFLITLLASPVYSGPIHELRWAMNVETLEYYKEAGLRFKKNIEKRTKGRIIVEILYSKNKNHQRDNLQDVQNGTYDMSQDFVNRLLYKVPSLSIWELPFLFDSHQHVNSFMASSYGRSSLKKLRKFGVEAIDYTYGDGFIFVFGKEFNHFSKLDFLSMTPIIPTEYYQKQMHLRFPYKARRPNDRSHQQLDINYSYMEIPSLKVEELRFNKAATSSRKLLNLTKHRFQPSVLFISQKFLAQLPVSLKEILIDEAKQFTQHEKRLSAEATSEYLDNYKVNKKSSIALNCWSGKHFTAHRSLFKKMYTMFEKSFVDIPIEEVIKLSHHKHKSNCL